MKFLLLIIPFLAFSQQQIAKGFVLNENTKTPIPYVNISILKSQIGTSSHEDGSYHLEIFKEDIDKGIKLSSLGYKDSIISVSKLIKLKTIYLKPLIEELNEVVITNKFEEKFLEINPLSKSDLCSGFGTSAKNPWIIASYFPFKDNYELTDYIKSVKFYFGNFKNKKSKFRLRLYSVGLDGLPNRDLISKNIIVELKRKQKSVEIDLTVYSLIFPREGFFVAFEWLYIPYNTEKVTYVFENKKNKKGLKYNPTFSGICQPSRDMKTAIYISGQWKDMTLNFFRKDKKIIPAISLTLSN